MQDIFVRSEENTRLSETPEIKTVLLIEDDQWIRENTSDLLQLEGYRVVTAPDGREGLEAARRDLPDLVLCDISMPHINGYQLLKIFLEDRALAPIPFVFFTASSEKIHIQRGLHMGARDYIVKPFTVDTLKDTIARNIR